MGEQGISEDKVDKIGNKIINIIFEYKQSIRECLLLRALIDESIQRMINDKWEKM